MRSVLQPANVPRRPLHPPGPSFFPYCCGGRLHAGSGTLLAALARGLPQLCLPQAADQFGNAAACVGAGAGRTLLPGTVTVESVRLGDGDRPHRPRLSAPPPNEIAAEIRTMPSPAEVAEIIATRYR